MKKTVFTIAAVAFLAVAGQAQDKSSKKEKATTSKESKEVKPDGTVSQSGNQEAESKREAKKGGTRMAINEKGMPGNAGKKEKEQPSSTKKD
jgi:hypothetical protein